jgi:CheY-like chemotaxis protein
MRRIVVVDDEEAVRLLYREELTEAGYAVDVAANGAEALAMVRERRPDLMTIDLKMPVMDGIELLGHVRQLYHDLPIIISTAYGDLRREFGTWASDAYLTKSADLGELKAKIRELLGE